MENNNAGGASMRGCIRDGRNNSDAGNIELESLWESSILASARLPEIMHIDSRLESVEHTAIPIPAGFRKTFLIIIIPIEKVFHADLQFQA
jgi:hypothetical protein